MHILRNKSQWMDIGWLFLLAIYVIAGATNVPFHGDESTVIYLGRDYYYQFVEGDLSKLLYDETWTISATDQQLRLLNSAISKNIYGWISYQNGFQREDINEQWDWGADYHYNQNTYRIPSETILAQSRIASSIELVIATIALFFAGKQIFNRPTAYLASLYFVLNPNVLLNGRRAMTEGSHLMGLMLVLLAAVWLIQHHRWWGYVLLGIVAGFGIAAKHPNAILTGLIFATYFALAIIQYIKSKRTQWRDMLHTIGGLLIAGCFTLLTFYTLNPVWWGTPFQSAEQALSLRRDLLETQSVTFGSYETVGDQINGLFDFVFVNQPQYYEVVAWGTYDDITSQIKAYEQSIWSGIAIGGTTFGGWIVLLLTGFGLFHAMKNTAVSFDYRWLIAICTIGIISLTFILTPLAWARYYLPIFPFVGLLLAYSVTTLASIFWTRITK